MVIYCESIHYGRLSKFSNKQKLILLVIGIGLLLHAISNQLILLVFDPKENRLIFGLISLASFFVIFYVSYKYYLSKIKIIKKLDEKLKNNSSN